MLAHQVLGRSDLLLLLLFLSRGGTLGGLRRGCNEEQTGRGGEQELPAV
jgi:hypothetical protein